MGILDGYFTPELLETGKEGYKFSSSGLYYSFDFDQDSPHKSYVDYILSLPINPEPEAFGMHDNANITCARGDVLDFPDHPLAAAARGVGRRHVARGADWPDVPPNRAAHSAPLQPRRDLDAVSGSLRRVDEHGARAGAHQVQPLAGGRQEVAQGQPACAQGPGGDVVRARGNVHQRLLAAGARG